MSLELLYDLRFLAHFSGWFDSQFVPEKGATTEKSHQRDAALYSLIT